MAGSPFDSIESAHQYVSLLRQEVQQVEGDVLKDIALAAASGPARRVDALRLVDYKLNQLAHHLAVSGRLLNDLRVLRRLLLGEREETSASVSDASPQPDESIKAGAGPAASG